MLQKDLNYFERRCSFWINRHQERTKGHRDHCVLLLNFRAMTH